MSLLLLLLTLIICTVQASLLCSNLQWRSAQEAAARLVQC
jgi:hypothetical protein